MPLFVDVHRIVEGSADDVVEAHRRYLETQGDYEVDYKSYWVDEDAGAVFCPFEGPDEEAGERVHREAHGLVADEIYEVQAGR